MMAVGAQLAGDRLGDKNKVGGYAGTVSSIIRICLDNREYTIPLKIIFVYNFLY